MKDKKMKNKKHFKIFLIIGIVFWFFSLSCVNAGWTESLSADLISYWKLNESSGDAFDSYGNNNGTVTGATQNVSGKIGTAYSFDGSGDDVNFGQGNLIVTTSFSVSLWVKKDNAGTSGMIASRFDNSAGNYRSWFIDTDNAAGKIEFYISHDGSSTDRAFRDGTTVLDNVHWYHVVGVYDSSSQTLKVYVNGSEETGTLTGTVGSSIYEGTIDTVIGMESDGGAPFSGDIDEVGIWGRALSDAEVLDLWNNGDGITYVFDTANPDIEITSPLNNTNHSVNNIEINYTVSDTNLDSCWYSNDTMTLNITLTNCVNIIGINWSEGQHNVTIWANDTSNNLNSSSITFNVDLTNPNTTINTPLNKSYSTNIIDFNIIATDNSDVCSCWYTLNSGTTNYSLTKSGDDYTHTNTTMAQGSHTANFYCNDTSDNINDSESVTFFVEDNLYTNLISYWRLDESSGDLIDNNDGTYNFTNSGATYGVTGKIKTAMYFNKTESDYAEVPATFDFNYNYTISVWFYWEGGNGHMFSIDSDDGHLTMGMTDGRIELVYNRAGIGNIGEKTTGNLSVGQWYHVVGTWNKGENDLMLYLNGVENSSNIYTCPSCGGWVSTKISLGVYGTVYFNGTIDEVGLWRRKLTASEISDLYNSGDGLVFKDEGVPNVTINTPLNQTYKTTTTLFNITATDNSDVCSCWYTLNSGTTNYSLSNSGNDYTLTNSTMSQGSHTANFYCNDTSNGINNSESVTFVIDTTPTSVLIEHPKSQSYGHNESLPLNFTSTDSGVGVDSCWFKVVNSSGYLIIDNKTITNCLNTTFNVSRSDTYNLTLYSNDTLDNFNSSLVRFIVSLESPSTVLDAPTDNQYLNNKLVYFNFTATDSDGLDTCELWGNWTGTWHKNYTWVNPTNATMNWTTQNISDGFYEWNVWCNDTFDLSGWASNNFTFTVDTIPNITLISPTPTTYTNLSVNSFVVNVSLTETYFSNLTFNLYNSSGLYNSTIFTGSIRQLNWSKIPEGNYTYNATVWTTTNQQNTTETRTISIDTTYPNITINSITTTAGSQTISFNSTEQDENLDSCKYSIFNSIGGYDVGAGINNTNVSFTCGVGLSHLATVTAYATYNLTIYAVDLAGNENSSTLAFTTSESGNGGGGGGGGSVTILGVTALEAVDFTITTVNFKDRIDISLAKDSKRPRKKNFYLTNSGIEPITLEIICDTHGVNESSKEIDICDYVTFPNKTFIVSPIVEERIKGSFEVMTPDEDSNITLDDQFFFNVVAVRTIGEEQRYSKLGVSARVSFLSTMFYKWSSITGKETEKEKQIIYPTAILSLIISFVLFLVVFFSLHKFEKTLTGFFSGTILFFLSYIGLVMIL